MSEGIVLKRGQVRCPMPNCDVVKYQIDGTEERVEAVLTAAMDKHLAEDHGLSD